jgi:hypothetical protein
MFCYCQGQNGTKFIQFWQQAAVGGCYITKQDGIAPKIHHYGNRNYMLKAKYRRGVKTSEME